MHAGDMAEPDTEPETDSPTWESFWTPVVVGEQGHTSHRGFVSTLAEAMRVKKVFEIENGVKFNVETSPKEELPNIVGGSAQPSDTATASTQPSDNASASGVGATDIGLRGIELNQRIRFSDVGDSVVVCDGVPFIGQHKRTFLCMFGKDKHSKQKIKAKQENNEELKEDHPLPSKRRYRLTQPSKKKGCNALIEMREVVRFPDFKVNPDASVWKKRQVSAQIREVMGKGEKVKTETRVYISLPDESDHNGHDVEKRTDMKPLQNVNLNAIEEAAQRVKGHIHVTPVMTCGMLNKMTDGRNLFFKCELLQKTGSFKIRGALNAVTKLIDSLPDGHEKPKVVTHSSGNFGQALAYAAQLKGLEAYVVMPETSPQCKIDAVMGYGADVIMCKPTEESRSTTCEEVQKRTGAHFFSPSQTYDVIAGQGTIGLELLDQIADLDAVIVPVGGGGMIAGIATALKNKNPAIKVFAAEPKNADDCFKSFQAKKLIPLPLGPVNTVADGLRVSIGQSTWLIIEHYVDDVITVTENEIKDATRNIWQFMKLFIEPSAGVGIAAALSPKFSSKAKELKNIAVILCGGNVDVEAVKHWL